MGAVPRDLARPRSSPCRCLVGRPSSSRELWELTGARGRDAARPTSASTSGGPSAPSRALGPRRSTGATCAALAACVIGWRRRPRAARLAGDAAPVARVRGVRRRRGSPAAPSRCSRCAPSARGDRGARGRLTAAASTRRYTPVQRSPPASRAEQLAALAGAPPRPARPAAPATRRAAARPRQTLDVLGGHQQPGVRRRPARGSRPPGCPPPAAPSPSPRARPAGRVHPRRQHEDVPLGQLREGVHPARAARCRCAARRPRSPRAHGRSPPTTSSPTIRNSIPLRRSRTRCAAARNRSLPLRLRHRAERAHHEPAVRAVSRSRGPGSGTAS